MSPSTKNPSISVVDESEGDDTTGESAPASHLPALGRASLVPISPPELGAARGWTHGWLVPAGAQLLFVAGQTAGDEHGHVANTEFVAQFETALSKCLLVVAAAGGKPDNIVRMTVFVTDMAAYLASRKAIGTVWRRLMGRHYPAMALFEVSRLVESGANVEIEVTAAVPAV